MTAKLDTGETGRSAPSDARRDLALAWLSLLGYGVSFLAAFAVGEGLAALMGYPTGGATEAPWYVGLLAGVPAVIVFVLPGLFALKFGRRAARGGQRLGLVPAIVGVLVGLAFVGLNVAAFFIAGM